MAFLHKPQAQGKFFRYSPQVNNGNRKASYENEKVVKMETPHLHYLNGNSTLR